MAKGWPWMVSRRLFKYSRFTPGVWYSLGDGVIERVDTTLVDVIGMVYVCMSNGGAFRFSVNEMDMLSMGKCVDTEYGTVWVERGDVV